MTSVIWKHTDILQFRQFASQFSVRLIYFRLVRDVAFTALSLAVGCQTQIKPEGEQVLVPCPRCHNRRSLFSSQKLHTMTVCSLRVRFASQKYNLARLFLGAGYPFVPEVHVGMSHLSMERTKGEGVSLVCP
jgi:hypothetical protein